MRTIAFLTAAAFLALGAAAVATPASAATIASCQDDVQHSHDPATGAGIYTSEIDQNSAGILAGLRDKGINVTDITDWGGCVEATVVRSNGTTAMEFFDPDSLQRLSRG